MKNRLEDESIKTGRPIIGKISLYQHQEYARRKKMLDPSDDIVIHCSNP